jgi:tetratricopeptide (TPR) repeat protein/tRNA A-37 threonylcarbamoyl transferase component Bud32
MGVVYLVEDAGSRLVALKLLHGAIADVIAPTRRFQREFRFMSRLAHPNIVEVYDCGEWRGRPYLVMEYVRGLPIHLDPGFSSSRFLGEVDRPWAQQLFRVLFGCLAETLAFIHGRGVVHRDLKPENLLVRRDGVLKVTDFGLALMPSEREEQSGDVLMGSLAYMSPEQALGMPLDARSDLYAVGGIMYRILAGRLPFQGSTPADRLRAQIHELPRPLREVNPRVPGALEAITMRLLEKSPDRRFATAAELAAALRDPSSHLAVRVMEEARPPGGEVPGDQGMPEEETEDTIALIGGRWRRYGHLLRSGDAAVHLVVRGEMGIGKTTLARFLAHTARRRGYRVYRHACGRSATAAYAVFQELFRDLGREVFGDAQAEGEPGAGWLFPLEARAGGLPRREVFLELEERIRCATARRPIALVIDDAQLVDPGSLALLEHLLPADPEQERGRRALTPDRFLVVLTARSAGTPASRAESWIARFSRASRTQVVQLPRLGRRDLAELARRELWGRLAPEELVDWLEERTSGVPLFAVLLLRHLQASGALRVQGSEVVLEARLDRLLPGSLRTLLERRFSGLPPELRRVTEAAAAIGREFDFGLLHEVLGGEEAALHDALDQLLHLEVLTERRSGRALVFDFGHDLYRDYFRELDPGRNERELHRRVAHAALRRRGRRWTVGSEAFIARHLALSGDLRGALAHHIQAGRLALKGLCPEEAVRNFEAGLALFARLEEGARRRTAERERVCRLALAAAYRQLGRHGEAQAVLGALVAAAPPGARSRLRALETLSSIHLQQARPELAEDALRRGLEAPQGAGQERERTLLAIALMELQVRRARFAGLESLRVQVLEVVSCTGNAGLKLQMMIVTSRELLGRRELLAAETHAREARRLARLIGAPLNRARADTVLGLCLLAQGRHEEAREVVQEALDYYRPAGLKSEELRALHELGSIALGQGRLDEADELLHEASRLARELGDQGSMAAIACSLGELALARGRLEEALDLLRKAHLEPGGPIEDPGRVRALAALCELLEQLGQREQLLQLGAEAPGLPGRQDLLPCHLAIAHHRGRALVRLGRETEAEELWRSRLESISAERDALGCGLLLLDLALLRLQQGDRPAAIQARRRALGLLETGTGWCFPAAMTLVELDLALGAIEEAARAIERIEHELLTTLHVPRTAMFHELAGRVARARGRDEDAERHAAQARRIHIQILGLLSVPEHRTGYAARPEVAAVL